MITEKHIWEILKNHFETNGFVKHQIDSFNTFLLKGIPEIILNTPKIDIDISTKEYDKYTLIFSDVYIPPPKIFNNRKIKSFFPNEARERNLTYESPICVNIVEIFKSTVTGEKKVKNHNRITIGEIPIMLQSDKCYLSKLNGKQKINAGECKYDYGGYFIVKGKERVIISQVRGNYNVPLIRSTNNKYILEMRSMSKETGHSILVKISLNNDHLIVINLPYIKNPISIGIVLKAYGVQSSAFYKIIGTNKKYKRYIRHMINDSLCVEGNSTKETKKNANIYIGKNINNIDPIKYSKQILNSELFPHLGILSSKKQKLYLIGSFIRKLLDTKLGLRNEDDRDNYMNKRIDSPGILCHDLLKQLFKKYTNNIISHISSKKQLPDILNIISKLTDITKGFSHCFSTGNWGVPKNKYIKKGVVQILSRLSFGSTLSNLRRISIPIGKESKNVSIRQINPSQIMYICPAETPEGAPVGIIMNLSLLTQISSETSFIHIKEILEESKHIISIDEYNDENNKTRVILNGVLIGFVLNIDKILEMIQKLKKIKYIHSSISICYNETDDDLIINCDGGRLLRPVFSLNKNGLLNIKKSDGISWENLTNSGKIVYIDNSEANNSIIAFNQQELKQYKNNYCEISPAMMLGVMASVIPFPDHSQSPRNCYQSAMGKQAMSVFSLSYQIRYDTIVHVLNCGQKPLVYTKTSELMGFNEMPYGVNCIVAIACYTGFNQEDSIILNKSSIQRGLFRSTTYKTFCEEETKQGYVYEKICIPPLNTRKREANYSLLGEDGVIEMRQNSVYVKKGDVIIGKTNITINKQGIEKTIDCSLIIKKGEEGYIDKILSSLTPCGYRLIKIVIRKNRIPEIGDKFASRAAQKGTVGMVYNQEDMPWTAEGITPDIIINPHCLTGDTIIEMADGDVEYIKNIFDKNLSIITVNPNTIEKSITKYTNGFMKNTNTLKQINTTSGRTIKCTDEHLMLVRRNNKNQWIKCKDLIPYSDKLFVTHTIIPVSNNDGNDLIIDKQSSIYWNRLETLGFVGKIDLCKTKILARLLGALESNGYLQLRNSARCILHLGEMEDYNEVCRDMNTLGFNKPSILKTNNCYWVELEVACGVLLKYLGACHGNKTKMVRIFPKWIKNGHMSIKREFLSGYHGGDGSKIVVNQKTSQQQVKIKGTRCRTYNNVKESHIEYLKCIISLYKDLGIKATLQQYSTKYQDKTDLMIYYSLTNENIILISDTIAYRYCNHKRRESIIAIEYLRTTMNGIKFEYEKFINCFSNNNCILSFVESVKNIPCEPVYDFTTESKNHSFVANGMVSHNCIPSRMTINQLMESVLGKSCVINGKFGDATPFGEDKENLAENICNQLGMCGYNRTGKEILYNGMTGEPMGNFFIGPVYYQRLKHMVSDKIHARSTGPVTTLTRQPLEGRSRDGGLRFGEMERDSIMSHGASKFLQERLFLLSDKYQVSICETCGNFCNNTRECSACENDNVNNVIIPYIGKLVIQELNTLLIKTKISTE